MADKINGIKSSIRRKDFGDAKAFHLFSITST